jgi:Uma2 family endonuclease
MSAGTVPPESVPDVSRIRTEDDTPVDNLFSGCQQHLLVEALTASWPGPGDGRPFLAAANVGVFASPKKPPIVPDVFVSLDVHVEAEEMLREHRAYFVWLFEKVPDVVIEIVSQTPGGEDTDKLQAYQKLNVPTYVIFDPGHYLSDEELRVYGLNQGRYQRIEPPYLTNLGIGLTVWEGEFRGSTCRWLRWTYADGNVIPTGEERAEKERERAESAERRVKELEGKVARNTAKLRDAGLSPNGE